MTDPTLRCLGCNEKDRARVTFLVFKTEVIREPLCPRCWRWAMLWSVFQELAADEQAVKGYDP